MPFIQSVLALALTLGILVTIHEWGHFWVARRCGVKVLRFSVGFGHPLFIWRDRLGTEFALAAIPLGGYVKMLDEREGDVPADQLEQAFNRKTPAQRIAIAVAGPAANFLFAILVYWGLHLVGFNTVAPLVGKVLPDSPAAMLELSNGDEILSINDQATSSWRDVAMSLIELAGEDGPVAVSIRSGGVIETRMTQLQDWLVGSRDPDPVRLFGLEPWRPQVPPVIDRVVEGGRAEQAGLLPGDRVLLVDGVPLVDWFALVDIIRTSAEKPLRMTVLREGDELVLNVIPAMNVQENGEITGLLGAGVKAVEWPPELIRTTRYDLLESFQWGLRETWDDTRMTLVSIQKMLQGYLSVRNLSGPVTIARVAEASVSSGLEHFVRFLAFLSISLGVLNLLPIPVLDGGHIVLYSIEALRGRPLSERLQAIGIRLGMTLILSLMVVALYNDLMRL